MRLVLRNKYTNCLKAVAPQDLPEAADKERFKGASQAAAAWSRKHPSPFSFNRNRHGVKDKH